MGWITTWAVIVDGRDASSAMNDWLRSIEVQEKEGGGGDTASLEFDDTGGEMYLPRAGARVQIVLGGVRKFDGYTEEPEWHYARNGGRTFSIHCTAHDSRGAVKDPQHWHQDGGTLQDFLGRAAKEAGIASVRIAPAFAAVARSWWSPSGASFLQLGRRLATELGGVFRIRGDQAILAERGSGTSVSGTDLPSVVFDCNDETVASVSGSPFTGHQSRTRAKVTWFDREQGKPRSEEVEIEPLDGAPESIAQGRWRRPNADGAKGAAKGRKNAAEHDKGNLTVKTDLRVGVSVGCPATLVNARPGIDGAYTVKSATHRLARSGGGTSDFSIARPEGKAGKDGRSKRSAAGSAKAPAGVQEAGAVPATPVA